MEVTVRNGMLRSLILGSPAGWVVRSQQLVVSPFGDLRGSQTPVSCLGDPLTPHPERKKEQNINIRLVETNERHTWLSFGFSLTTTKQRVPTPKRRSKNTQSTHQTTGANSKKKKQKHPVNPPNKGANSRKTRKQKRSRKTEKNKEATKKGKKRPISPAHQPSRRSSTTTSGRRRLGARTWGLGRSAGCHEAWIPSQLSSGTDSFSNFLFFGWPHETSGPSQPKRVFPFFFLSGVTEQLSCGVAAGSPWTQHLGWQLFFAFTRCPSESCPLFLAQLFCGREGSGFPAKFRQKKVGTNLF